MTGRADGGSSAGGRVGHLVGPAIAIGLGLLLVVRGDAQRGLVLGGFGLAIALVTSLSARARLAAARAAGVVGRGAGRVLGVALLAPAYYLVVAPLGLLLRLLGARPVDLEIAGGRPSYWTARRRGTDPSPRRLYTDQRSWSPVGTSAGGRRRLVVTTVVVTLLVQAIVAGSLWWVRSRPEGPPPATGVSSASAPRTAALRGLEWADDAFREQTEAIQGAVYTPVIGHSLTDYSGEYFNVTNRVRRSYEYPLPDGVDPVEIWFFGGSTMFGTDLQRDDHTIPSYVARRAEQDGLAVRVRNYGTFAYLNYQETLLLQLVLGGPDRPDVVVFYDGLNDVQTHFLQASSGLGPRGEPGELNAALVRDLLGGPRTFPGEVRRPPSPLGLLDPVQPATADALIDELFFVYENGRDIARRLADEHDFELFHFWQPQYFTRDPLDPEEGSILEESGMSDPTFEATREYQQRVIERLPDGVIDISDAFDDAPGPVFSDFIHHNELGASYVADAMYEHLRPVIEARLDADG